MADDFLPSDRTVKNELHKLGCNTRNHLKYRLLEAAGSKALSISPDNWTDNHRRITYMGATAHFIDGNLTYQAVDLFCVEFMHNKKTAENTYRVSRKIKLLLEQKMSNSCDSSVAVTPTLISKVSEIFTGKSTHLLGSL